MRYLCAKIGTALLEPELHMRGNRSNSNDCRGAGGCRVPCALCGRGEKKDREEKEGSYIYQYLQFDGGRKRLSSPKETRTERGPFH